MQFLKKFALVTATALLPIFLFSFGLMLSFYQVYSTPDSIKNALKESGIYKSFIGDVLKHTDKEEGQQANDTDVPVDNPEVQKIIQDAAPPEFLQSQAEGFVDSLYTWLRGESNQLDVNINLSEAKAKLAEGLAQYAANRVATLPACTTPQANFDPLNAECIPPGTTQASAAEQVRQEINNGEFLKDPQITQSDIKNDQGKTLEDQLSPIPNVFDAIVAGLWTNGTLIVLMTVAIILLQQPWRAGLKRTGIIYTIVGASTAAIALIGAGLANAAVDSLDKSGEATKTAAEALKILFNDFQVWWLGFGLVVLLIGIAMLVSLRFIKAGKEPTLPAKTSPKPAKATAPKSKQSKNPRITKTV